MIPLCVIQVYHPDDRDLAVLKSLGDPGLDVTRPLRCAFGGESARRQFR